MTMVREPLDLPVSSLVELAQAAGEAVLEVYERVDHEVEFKGDGSPLTAADRAANGVIVEGLRRLAPKVPVLSEESREVPFSERKEWGRFWCVDPLDGTKEFVKRNGEFTVNIALIESGVPVLGVVHAPVLEASWFGSVGHDAWRVGPSGHHQRITVREPPEDAWTVVASRSHRDEATEAFLSALPPHEVVSCGSSMKICRVAEGNADLYPRFGPTMEWDTAAAHAVLTAAGGRLLSVDSRRPLAYNKQDLLNPGFIATGPIDPWGFFDEVVG